MQTETIALGGGCFWCTEAVFGMLKGVASVEPGYAGPEKVEVIKIEYDPDHIAFEELLRVFFATHDPTTPNQQGNDVGPQYQSAIFYTTPRQQEKAQHYIDVLNKSAISKKLVTKVLPLDTFYLAEGYHKNYYEKNRGNGYCTLVIDPKVERVQTKFKDLLK